MYKYVIWLLGIVFFFAGFYMIMAPFLYVNGNGDLSIPLHYYHILAIIFFIVGGLLVYWYTLKKLLSSF